MVTRRRGLRWCLGIVALLTLLGGGAAGLRGAASGLEGLAVDDPPSLGERAPRMSSAARQLAYARALQRALRGREGESAERIRERAVEAYRAVRLHHPEARLAGAEGAFRAGELLRAVGHASRARAEFVVARARGAGSPFAARAGLEIGHLERREGRGRLALDAYLAVAADEKAKGAYRDDAWLWAGRTWQLLECIDDARRAWRTVAEGGADPLDRILAYDHLAQSWIDVGDLEAAAAVLEECRRTHTELARERTHTGERVRAAFRRMRAREQLSRAIERRFRARDAHESTLDE